jgi:hypothetical protein
MKEERNMLDGLLAIFSTGSSSDEIRRDHLPFKTMNSYPAKTNGSSAVYINKDSLDGRRGYVLRLSPSEEGYFYQSIKEIASDIVEMYKRGYANTIDTLEVPFKVEKLTAVDIDRVLTECRLETETRPSLSDEVKRQIGLRSEPKINVSGLHSSRARRQCGKGF